MFQLFLFCGICINELGNIFIVDESNYGIYVLNKDGGFLIMLIIFDDLWVSLIFLCLDYYNNICIGCVDGKIKILKYLG